MQQIINVNIGIEQDIIISYKNIVYRFELFFNDYFNYWFINIYNDDNNILIQSGIRLLVNYDSFKGLGLDIGELKIIDTLNDGSNYDIKLDFGDRLKLVREI